MSKNSKTHNFEIEKTSEESYSEAYTIKSWGADLSFRELLLMYEQDDLLKPELQRNYVWSKFEASRFIDSVLLGLPVPSIFLAKDKNEKLLIVDGFQRIMTIYDFVKGFFSDDKSVFRLSESSGINKNWQGKTFEELESNLQRKIKNTTIHAILFEQMEPDNDTGMYQIFERINTSGRTLKPQEIRNCVYHGIFNKLLFELNNNHSWRCLLESEQPDSRMLDLEFILRYFAMCDLKNHDLERYQINLTKYLNKYMSYNRDIDDNKYQFMKKQFETMVESINSSIGVVAFRKFNHEQNKFLRKINPATFDAVTVATTFVAEKDETLLSNLTIDKYKRLMSDEEFLKAISSRTTDISNIKSRINLATQYLYGIEYEW